MAQNPVNKPLSPLMESVERLRKKTEELFGPRILEKRMIEPAMLGDVVVLAQKVRTMEKRLNEIEAMVIALYDRL